MCQQIVFLFSKQHRSVMIAAIAHAFSCAARNRWLARGAYLFHFARRFGRSASEARPTCRLKAKPRGCETPGIPLGNMDSIYLCTHESELLWYFAGGTLELESKRPSCSSSSLTWGIVVQRAGSRRLPKNPSGTLETPKEPWGSQLNYPPFWYLHSSGIPELTFTFQGTT